MREIRVILAKFADEVELASDVDACIEKYARQVETALKYKDIPSYQVLSCIDSGVHNKSCDDDGYCNFCHDQWVPAE